MSIKFNKLPKSPLTLNEKGFLLPALLSFIIAMGILSGAVLEVILTNFTVVGNNQDSQKAFNIAEAGINYYLWHLSHNSTDFKDGGTTPATPVTGLGYGPYVHNYIDSNAVTEGTFTLYVNPQPNGSTIATIRSIGLAKGSNITRTISAQIGAPSFASYAVAADSPLWFGNTESADGPVHSNAGVRMDGESNAEISSANTTYVPPYNLGGNGSASHPGVWCDSSITTPVNCNTRSKNNWVYPVPSVNFNQVSTSLCTMKKVAFNDDSRTASLATQANACTQSPTTRTASYVPQYNSSGSYSATTGYLIQLNNNSTYNLYKVASENDAAANYSAALGLTTVATNIALPPSGVIYVEDNVWVRTATGSNFAGRVTIASGRLASSTYNTNITVADNLLYSTKNGNDAIGLVTVGSVFVAPYAPPRPTVTNFTFEVDAAVLAQAGNVYYGEDQGTTGATNGRSVYRGTTTCTTGWAGANQKFLFYGSIATRQLWTWTWLGGNSCGNAVPDGAGNYVSGILHNTTQYDYNLQYAPPPSYPVTSGYNILSWREVLTKP